MTESIRLPTPPQPPEKPTFPLLASAAPVVGALAMWAFTQSPFALVFAFLGPLVAIGGLIDSRRRHTKSARASAQRFAAELADTAAQIDAAHDEERYGLDREVAPAFDLIAHGSPTRRRWRHEPGDPLTIALGIGATASSLRVGGLKSGGTNVDDTHIDSLAARSAILRDAPVLCDARDGVGILGTYAGGVALLRALALQLAHRVGPNEAAISLAGPAVAEGEWLRQLPHPTAEAAEHVATRANPQIHISITLNSPEGKRLALVAFATEERLLPRDCRIVVRVTGTSAELIHSSEALPHATEIRPHLIAREHAVSLAASLHQAAEDDDLVQRDVVAREVTFDQLGAQPTADSSLLACAFAIGGANAPVTIDLVSDGPHALVGGTTGSGKSELLCAWVLAMAATRAPTEFTVLLVDFKGGASFRVIESLPHCVGTVTDLDPAEAERALTSLQAELRYRERALAEHGVRDVAELERGVLPRLVIVVDEYAALVADHPALHTVFADISARGRSLGVHLIISTQRPAGVVRDAVFSNAAIRVSLRVLDQADSIAVIGVADAAALSSDHPGSALISVGGRAVERLQPALVTAQDVATVRTATASSPDKTPHMPRRPWLPPLPVVVTPRELARHSSEGSGSGQGGDIRFALVDRPAEQRQLVASYDPHAHGHLLIVGAKGSGRSTALAMLGHAARDPETTTVVPGDIEGAWDAVHTALDIARAGAASGATPRLCLFDDLDTLISRLPDDYRDPFVRTLSALLQEGPASGIHCAITAARVTPATSAIAALCESRLVLRMPDRHEHQLAGADPARFDSELPPGRGWWRGDLVQVAHLDAQAHTPATHRPLESLERRSMLIVSTRPVQLRDALDAAWGSGTAELLGAHAPPALTVTEPGEPTRVLIAEPEVWQGRWGQFTELGRHLPVAFHQCSVSLYRQLSGSRTLPPPLAHPVDSVWLAHPGSGLSRAALPRLVPAPTPS